MADAREEILLRIREQLHYAVGEADADEAYASIARNYTQAAAPGANTIEVFVDRLVDYDAEVIEPASVAEIASTVAGVLRKHGESILLVPPAMPDAWLPEGCEILRDGGGGHRALPLATLMRAHAVLTTCAGAVAETGTILLEHGAEQGRRVLTLLPDHHICILRRSQVVGTVSEGISLLAACKCSAMTTLSGPSATADIEMTRIRGVHGPRRLTVLLLG